MVFSFGLEWSCEGLNGVCRERFWIGGAARAVQVELEFLLY